MPYKKDMSAAIAYTTVYEKRVGKVLRAEERNAMELHVAHHPEIHPVGGVRVVFAKHGGAAKEKENEAVSGLSTFIGQRPTWSTFSTSMQKPRRKI